MLHACLARLCAVRKALAPHWNLLAPLVLLLANYPIFIGLQDLQTSLLSWSGLLIVYSPLLFAYCLLRLILAPLTSSALITLVHLVLSIANYLKTFLTTQPLQYQDLFATENFAILRHYLTPAHVLILIAIPLLLWLVSKFAPNRRTLRTRLVHLACAALLTPFALHPYLSRLHSGVAESVQTFIDGQGIHSSHLNIAATVQTNGLPLYLVQTSLPTGIPQPTAEDRRRYADLRQTAEAAHAAALTGTPPAPRNVLIILCESCWNHGEHFRQQFAGLHRLGFREFRAISPVYGGTTVNAAFEMLTGLPVHNFPHPNRIADPAITPVTPALYQVYGKQFAPHVDTLAAALHKQGYETTNAHNFYGMFWQRNIVTRKFGFDHFYSLEDMTARHALPDHSKTAAERYPQDHILYQYLLERADLNRPNFIFLTTMFTHGPFESPEDYGSRLHTALEQMATFLQDFLHRDPDALVLIFGDHMPAMNSYYYENNIFPPGVIKPDHGFTDKASIVPLGNVPILVHHSDPARLQTLIDAAHDKPFYCLSTLLDRTFLHTAHPIYTYAAEHHTCEQYTPQTYNQNIRLYPDWLYTASLFDTAAR